MTNRAAASFEAGPPTAARIVYAALDLTREHGFSSWTPAQLACVLEVDPHSVHEAAGDREEIGSAVLAVVADQVPVAPAKADLGLREKLRRHAGAVRAALTRYPGCARPLAQYASRAAGPARPLLDEIVKLFTETGFGEDVAGERARVFLTQVCLLVSIDDDRRHDGAPDWLAYSEGLPFFGRAIDALLEGVAARPGTGVRR